MLAEVGEEGVGLVAGATALLWKFERGGSAAKLAAGKNVRADEPEKLAPGTPI